LVFFIWVFLFFLLKKSELLFKKFRWQHWAEEGVVFIYISFEDLSQNDDITAVVV